MSAAITIGISYPTPPLGITPERVIERLKAAVEADGPKKMGIRLARQGHPLALIELTAAEGVDAAVRSAAALWDAAEPELSRIIVDVLQQEWVYRRFRPKSLAENQNRRQIETRVRHLLRSPAHDPGIRATVRAELQQFFAEQPREPCAGVEISVHGFIRFRLDSCLQKIDALIENARSQVARELERGELLQLLQQIVGEQAPTPAYVDVIRTVGGRYRLLDAARQPVDTEYLRGDVFDLVHSESDRVDLLFSALITLMPRKLTCHFECEPIVKSQLRQLFQERIRFCPGCELCTEQPLALTPAARTVGFAAEKISPRPRR